jgi:hypothetical protein
MNTTQATIQILLLALLAATINAVRVAKRSEDMEESREEPKFTLREILEHLVQKRYCAKYSADNRRCELEVGGGPNQPSFSYSGSVADQRYGTQGDFSGYNKQCIDQGRPSWQCLNVGKGWIAGKRK